MHYLNTVRHLSTPASPETTERLRQLLVEQIIPSVENVEGMVSIAWLLSHDRRTLQAFSGWAEPQDAAAAEHNPVHATNSAIIKELLGGLAVPQEHYFYELLGQRSFR